MLAGVRQDDAAAGVLQQVGVQRLLQRFDVFTQRWLRDVQVLRRLCDRTVFFDRQDIVQFLEQHTGTSFHCSAESITPV